MAIRVTHTPYEAMGQLAVQAGEAQQRVREQEAQRAQRHRLVLENARSQHAMQRMQFQSEIQEAQREKEYLMKSALIEQKQQIAMQMSLQKFQADRQKLISTIDLIERSDYLSPREKEKAKVSAYSRYADADVPSSIFEEPVMGGPTYMTPEEKFEMQGDITTQYARLQDVFDQKYAIRDDEIKVKYKKGTKTKYRDATAPEKAEALWVMDKLRDLRVQSEGLEGEDRTPADTAINLENLFRVNPNLKPVWEQAQQEGVSPQQFLDKFRRESQMATGL